jgi:hypothetical protein
MFEPFSGCLSRVEENIDGEALSFAEKLERDQDDILAFKGGCCSPLLLPLLL